MKCSVRLPIVPLNITKQYASMFSKCSALFNVMLNAFGQGFMHTIFLIFFHSNTLLMRTRNKCLNTSCTHSLSDRSMPTRKDQSIGLKTKAQWLRSMLSYFRITTALLPDIMLLLLSNATWQGLMYYRTYSSVIYLASKVH